MAIYDQQFEHLLRRAGFGARPDELDAYRRLGLGDAVDGLIYYDRIVDDVDTKIGQPGYAQIVTGGRVLQPNTVITDAQQRWLFRMLHTNRPLQEKMTLFWHNHFATAYTKLAGAVTPAEATRYMAAKRRRIRAASAARLRCFATTRSATFRRSLSRSPRTRRC